MVAAGIFLGAAPGALAGGFGPATTVYEGPSPDSRVELTDLHGHRAAPDSDAAFFAADHQIGSDSAIVIGAWITPSLLDTEAEVGQAARVDHCAGEPGWAYARVEGAVKTVMLGTPIEPESEPLGDDDAAFSRPDIACAEPARQAVSFLRKDGTGLHAWMFTFDATWSSDDLNYGVQLGSASKGSTPAIAATPDVIHVAWKQGSKLRYKRFTVGAGPDHPITPLPTRTLDTSSSLDEVRLAADGKRVVVAWERGSTVVARVSTDKGASWKPRTTLFQGGGPAKADAAVTNADVRGKTIIVSATVWTCFEGCGGTGSIKRSTTNGASWAKVEGSTKQGGYVFGALAGERSAPSMFMAWDQRFNLVPVIKARYAP
jgi:hypothetical protein